MSLGGVFDTATIKFIVPYPYHSSSLLRLQRRHRTKRRESPLLAKEETLSVEGIWLTARNLPQLLGSFTCPKVGTWDRLFNLPSEGRPGLNPRTREPGASMRTTRPPKPSSRNIKTDNSPFARVEQFKYLGTTSTNQNSTQE
jgi:hypothetical protein